MRGYARLALIMIAFAAVGSVSAEPPPDAPSTSDSCAEDPSKPEGSEKTALEAIREMECLLAPLDAARKLLESDTATPDPADLNIIMWGRQFDWRYEYRIAVPDQKGLVCVTPGDLMVPQGKRVQLVVTSDDIIHEWSVPDLGLKGDAVPGRMNSVFLDTSKTGAFNGGVSKMSGKGYAQMKIVLRIVPQAEYAAWEKSLAESKSCRPEGAPP